MRFILFFFPSLPLNLLFCLSCSSINFCFHFLGLGLISIYHKANDHLGWSFGTLISCLQTQPACIYILCWSNISYTSFTFHRGIAILRTILQIGMLRLRKVNLSLGFISSIWSLCFSKLYSISTIFC